MALLITEREFEHVKPVVETTESGKKNLFIEGIYMQGEKKNRNGRIYPMHILDREAKRYNEQYVLKNRALGELNHPPTPVVDPKNACHMVTKLWKEDNNWHGKSKVLSTPMGAIVAGLIDDGVELGVSTRGLGSLKESKGSKVVQSDFFLGAVDVVSDPSAQEAWVQGIYEGKEWAVPNDQAQVEMMKEIDTAVRQGTLDETILLDKFEDLMIGLTETNMDGDSDDFIEINEAKKMAALGDGVYITKVGYDTNGNWSYWIKDSHSKRARKVQHGNLDHGSYTKITKDDMRNFTVTKVKDTVKGILSYYRQHMVK